MLDALGHVLTRLGVLTAHPATFVILIVYVCLGLAFDPESLGWHAGAVIAVWMMTLFIQRAVHRDTQALHGKLDELLRAHDDARSELAELDQKQPEENRKASRTNGGRALTRCRVA